MGTFKQVHIVVNFPGIAKISKTVRTIVLVTCLVNPFLLLAQNIPFNRGVNLTNWFQSASPQQIQFTKFTKQDLINIKSLGCDVIRLPLNLLFMTNGEPDFTIDPLFLFFLDSAVNWAEEVEIYLLLDNHSYSISLINNSTYETALLKIWTQMAERYKDRSEFIIYEIQNEPHDISDALWGSIQGNVLETIREIDTERTIIIGPASWNSYNNLQFLPDYNDNNLIFTFHFYDPFLFTHQGASWTDPSMVPVSGIPFPYNANDMPDSPPELSGTWVEALYNSYPGDGTGEKIREWLDVAIDFRDSSNVPVYCGELGVYNINCTRSDRIAWYDSVTNYLYENEIPWTMWDYTGSFGLFEDGGNNLFDYDLDTVLLNALGLNIPPQKEFILKPDTVGFPIYRDYIENKIVESSYTGEGIIDFYNTVHPNNGMYCIYWTGGEQYATIGFDLLPDKDLHTLVDSNYALDMLIRSNSPGVSLDIRFIDTESDIPEDKAWRIRYTIDETVVEWDGTWSHIHIPLSDFEEHGCWDGEWHDPIGAYDWSSVDRFEIVAEHHSLENIHFWFDNILVSNLDTARIWNDTVIPNINGFKANEISFAEIQAFPNPFTENTILEYTVQKESEIRISIFNIAGQLITTLVNAPQSPGKYSIVWNGKSNNGNPVQQGLYYCHLSSNSHYQVIKIVRL